MKNKLCTIYIARHGQTKWNVQGLIQGHTNSPLTENGINQAKNLAAKLKKIKFDAVFSSDLLRAKKTAEILALEHQLIVETEKALRERNFGPYEGKHKNNLELLEEIKSKGISLEDEGVEDDEQLIARVITFLREIAVAYPGKNILMVSHGGVIRTLLEHFGFDLKGRGPDNGSYVKLQSDGIDFYIKQVYGLKKSNSWKI